MAEQVTQDVVKEAQSMGDRSPIDESAATTNPTSAGPGQATQPLSDFVAQTQDAKTTDETVPQGASEVGFGEGRAATPVIVEEGTDEPLQFPGEEGVSSSAIADLSGGSDTDSSRPDGLESGKETIGHVRSNSIKKPATFKSVSVTKSFLAKAATASPVAKGIDSRGTSPASASAAQSSARPRLVAKSGSGGLTPRSGLAKGGTAAGNPDASKVWNKNQPVAPAPPKQLTDEELKQQYGIHMATRLQADEGGKESKWADIDDDEDDWVPESVEWMDGTKSSVIAGEALPTPQEESNELQDPHEVKPPARANVPIVAQRPTSTSGMKTILKPGAHSLPSPNVQKATNGLVLKGAPEKPTLVAKSPAPTPVKSPWAPLPPVDKVPPVAPPVQPTPQARFGQQDPHGFGSLPPLVAAKEIAADDFNRTWRDEQTNRTLFDSKSGRYEPVNEARRNSFRDHGFRQPAVLQRPTGDAKGGPAEPSAAFQTSRSGVEGSWGRRRASSSLSGGSGALARRMSVGRSIDGGVAPVDMQQQRRESSSLNGSGVSPVDQFRAGLSQDVRSLATPTTPRWTRASALDNHEQPIQDEQHSEAIADTQQGPGAAADVEPAEDAVARQQRMMREKLDRARAAKQRELEKEKEEAAARAERLRLKMASLAPPSPAPTTANEITVGNSQSEPMAESKQTPGNAVDATPPRLEQLSPSKATSPPRPQIPSTDGETTQFGLIKLHPSQSTRKVQQDSTFGTRPFQSQQQSQFQNQPESLRATSRNMHAPLTSTPKPEGIVSESAMGAGPQQEGIEPAFARNHDLEGGWGQTQPPQTSATGNIWGAGIGTLGNGTFNNPSQQQLQGGDAQPRQSKQKEARTGGHFAGGRYVPAAAGGENPQAALNAWAQFKRDLPSMQKAETEQQMQQLEQLKQSGYQTTARVQVIHKKTDPDTGRILGENSNTARSDHVVHTAQPLGGLPNGTAVAPGSGNLIGSLAPSSASSRTSLNRAVGAERAQSSHPGATKPSSKFADFFGPRAGSNSPPPPDALNNELLDGNPRVPGVKLPAPKPQVRLPSASTGAPAVQPPATQAQNATLPPLTTRPSQPLAASADWASRFRNLLSNDNGLHATSQAGGAVQPISSATKTTFSVTGAASHNPATVSLPSSKNGVVKTSRFGFVVDTSASVTSKPTAEEALLEEQQFGSLPAVRTPQQQYLNQHLLDFPRKSLARHPNNKFRDRPIEVLTIDTNSASLIEIDSNNKGTVVTIMLPGMTSQKTKLVPRKFHHSGRQFSGSGRGRGRGNHAHHNHSPRAGAHA